MGKNPAFSRPNERPPHPANKSIKVGVFSESSFIVLNNYDIYYEPFECEYRQSELKWKNNKDGYLNFLRF